MRQQNKGKRKAAVAVEFAVIAPVLVLLVGAMCELGQATCGATKISSAIREGGRLASMDFKGKLEANQTPNQKVRHDILKFLSITGVRTANVTVTIEHAEGALTGQTFDLASTDNYLKLFRIRVVAPYSSVSTAPLSFMRNRNITVSNVFRRGRNAIQ
jgi:Flp pilus assembly protein TadG